jgi:hypothetical protein
VTDHRPDPIDDLLRSGASAFPEAPAPDRSRLNAVLRTSRRRDLRSRGTVLAGAAIVAAGGAALALRDPGEQVDVGTSPTTGAGDTTETTVRPGEPDGLAMALVCGIGVPESPVSYADARVIGIWSDDPDADLSTVTVTVSDPVTSTSVAAGAEGSGTFVGVGVPVLLPEAAIAGPEGVGGLVVVPDVDSTGAAVFADATVRLEGGPIVGSIELAPGGASETQESGGQTVVVQDTTVEGLLAIQARCAGVEDVALPPEAEEPMGTTVPPGDPGGAPTTTVTTAPPELGDELCRIEGDGDGTVGLWVSNQSFAEPSIELEVLVDGRTVAHDTYEVDAQHTFIQYEVIWSDAMDEVVVRWDGGEVVVGPVEAGNGVIVQYWGADTEGDPVQVEVVENCADVAFG